LVPDTATAGISEYARRLFVDTRRNRSGKLRVAGISERKPVAELAEAGLVTLTADDGVGAGFAGGIEAVA